jgi:hypothetical protein
VVAAMDATGNVAIWTVSYTIAWRNVDHYTNGSNSTVSCTTTVAAAVNASGSGGGLWSKLFGNRTAAPQSSTRTDHPTLDTTTTETGTTVTTGSSTPPPPPPQLVPTLTILPTEPSHRIVQRFALTEFGVPTAFALNPAYPTLSQVVTAFDSGKLVLTTVRGGSGSGGASGGAPWRGGGANGPVRLDHALLPYTGGPPPPPPPLLDQDKSNNDDWRGVEALAWRGSLLAVADAGGVKLYDTLTLSALAQVDRPVGARPSLYHASLTVVPHLVWEQSRQLLVAWGDCLLTLTVTEATAAPQSATETANGAESSATTTASTTAASAMRKRTVACTMAWGLDCVAAGVVPIDRNHVAVMGRRIDWRRDEATTPNQPIVVVPDENDDNDGVELQVLDRSNGCVVYADLLPLRQQPTTRTESNDPSNGQSLALAASSAAHFQTMLSSFAVPRMDDALEARQSVRLRDVQASTGWSRNTIVCRLSFAMELGSRGI